MVGSGRTDVVVTVSGESRFFMPAILVWQAWPSPSLPLSPAHLRRQRNYIASAMASGTRLLFPDLPDELDQVRQRAAEPVELPHHQHIAGLKRRERLFKPGPLRGGAGNAVLLDLPAAGRPLLQVELLIFRRNARA